MSIQDTDFLESLHGEAERERREFLTCKLGEETYGIDILQVQEIREIDLVTRIPHVARFVRGVINLRGAIVPVVDLGLMFSFERCRSPRRAHQRTWTAASWGWWCRASDVIGRRAKIFCAAGRAPSARSPASARAATACSARHRHLINGCARSAVNRRPRCLGRRLSHPVPAKLGLPEYHLGGVRPRPSTSARALRATSRSRSTTTTGSAPGRKLFARSSQRQLPKRLIPASRRCTTRRPRTTVPTS